MVSMCVIKRNRTIHLATLSSAVLWEKLLLKSVEQIFTVKKLTLLKHGLIQCILLHLYILLQIPTSKSAELLLYIHTIRIWAAMGTSLV